MKNLLNNRLFCPHSSAQVRDPWMSGGRLLNPERHGPERQPVRGLPPVRVRRLAPGHAHTPGVPHVGPLPGALVQELVHAENIHR